jgi:fructose-1,6-bisphosphatase I
MLVYTTGKGVNGFTYDPTLGEYFLSHQDMKIPDDGLIYSINEAASGSFPEPVNQYLQYCRDNAHTARYIGSLVADFHRNLLKGGIYIYPQTPAYPDGKLRLMYECNALAFVVEQAGGKASTGQHRIMEIIPGAVHDRCQLYIGSKSMVEKAESFITPDHSSSSEL